MAIANNDAFTTGDNVTFSGNVFADNGSGADDGGGGALAIAAVNGNAASVGNEITLASGSRLRLNADGTFTYIPWTGFQAMPAPGSGASDPTSALDSFTYRLTNGETATVSITINGLDNQDTFHLTHTSGSVFGGAGSDTFIWEDPPSGGTLDGGDGFDQIVIYDDNQGDLDLVDYQAITGIEAITSFVRYVVLKLRPDQFAGLQSISLAGNIVISGSGAADISGISILLKHTQRDGKFAGIVIDRNRLTIDEQQLSLFNRLSTGGTLIITNGGALTGVSSSARMQLYGLLYNLEFADNGNRVVSGFGNSGGVVTENTTDTAGTESWSSRSITYNYLTQKITAQTRVLDNGNTQVFSYNNGVLTQIVETDTDNDDDFVTITTTYAADGTTISGRTILLDNGNTQVFTYAGGVPTQMVETDTDNDDDFVTITTTYAADGVTTTGKTTLLDNGNTQVTSYVDGLPTQMVETQTLPDGNTLVTTFVNGLATHAVETDTDGDDDFVTITTTYAADGATISGRTILLDNGNTQVVSYAGGVATQMVETDTDNDDDFVTITTTYAADGTTISGRTILLDNGNTQVISYAGGVATQMVETDTDNDDDFVSITTTYEADGTTIAGKTTLLDNGNTQVTSYAGGIATQMVETDTDNDDDFVTITTTYAADGTTISGRTILLDNSNTQVFTYVGGLATRMVETDAGGNDPFETIATTFEADGQTRASVHIRQDNNQEITILFENGAPVSFSLLYPLMVSDPDRDVLDSFGFAMPRDDRFVLDTGNTISGNLFVDNGHGVDSNPSGTPLQIVAVNGQPAAVGQPIMLDGFVTAFVRVDENGDFVLQLMSWPDDQLAEVSFTYSLANGMTATAAIALSSDDTVTTDGVNMAIDVGRGGNTIIVTTSNPVFTGSLDGGDARLSFGTINRTSLVLATPATGTTQTADFSQLAHMEGINEIRGTALDDTLILTGRQVVAGMTFATGAGEDTLHILRPAEGWNGGTLSLNGGNNGDLEHVIVDTQPGDELTIYLAPELALALGTVAGAHVNVRMYTPGGIWGEVSRAGLQSLLAAGVETVLHAVVLPGSHGIPIIFSSNANGSTGVASNGHSLALFYDGENLTHVVDTDPADPGHPVTTYYNPDGSIERIATILGDGTLHEVYYLNGQPLRFVQTDVADDFDWQTRSGPVQSQGGKQIAVVLDNGVTGIEYYMDGVLVGATYEDAEGTQDFISYDLEFVGQDRENISKMTVRFDNGNTQVFFYTDSVLTQDVLSDANGDDDFVTITTAYAADGVTITGKTILLDNGNTQVFSYAGGIATQMVETDTDNDDDFVTITTTYAADGVTITGKTIYLDEGNEQHFQYTDGILTGMIEYDTDADDDFTTMTRVYGPVGQNIVSDTYALDNGGTRVVNYAANGDRTQEVRSAGGLLLSRTLFDLSNSTSSYAQQTMEYANGIRARTTLIRDNGDTAELLYQGGKAVSFTYADGGANDAWSTRKYEYAADGVTLKKYTLTLDNGDSETKYYEDGKLARRNLNDGSNSKSYSSTDSYYDVTGAMIRFVMTDDDGDTTETHYSDGHATGRTFTDVDDDMAWTTLVYEYAADGKTLTKSTRTSDNGDTETAIYVDGHLAEKQYADLSNTRTYEDYSIFYAADGSVTRKVVNYDTGYSVETSFVGNVRRSAHYVDQDVTYGRIWTEYTNTYNASGVITRQTGLYDNGNRWETFFLNGLRAVQTQFDDADIYAYERRIVTYAADGVTRTNDTQVLDDGGLLLRQYETGTNIAGGVGNDIFWGADGADTFVFSVNSGHDTIGNFQDGIDRLNIEAFGLTTFAQLLALTQELSPTRIQINLTSTVSATIDGLSLATLDVSDFTHLLSTGGTGGTGGVGGGGPPGGPGGGPLPGP